MARRLRLAAGPVVAAILLPTYLWVGDSTVWGEWLTIWPPVGWGALLIVRASVLWLERQMQSALATVLAAILLVGATTEWRSLLRRPMPVSSPAVGVDTVPNPRTRVVRVVSWNVSGGAPLDALVSLRPDICFLQEIGALCQGVGRAPVWNGSDCLEGLDPGLVSRFPLRRIPSARIGPWVDPLLAVAELPDGRRLLLVNVRLTLPGIVVAAASPSEWRGIVRGHAERTGQFPRLAALIERRRREHSVSGVVLAGDFNTPGGMPSLAPLAAGLRDVWPLAGRGWGATMTAEWPLSRIDQCWVSGELVAREARVERRPGSDHRLLVVDLELGVAASADPGSGG